LIDPGPAAAIPALRRNLQAQDVELSDVSTILLTHIHLDHAGSVGALVEQNPKLQVFVHSRGAQHLIDPAKLIDSASRVSGTNIETLWGVMRPTSAANVRILHGGEKLQIGTRSFEVLYTPGHAIHHVSFIESDSGIAFVGDALGIRVDDSFVFPATPPPDIDVEALSSSADLIHSRSPQHLFLTHFGLKGLVEWHIAEFRNRLKRWSDFVRMTLEMPGDDVQRAQLFSEMTSAEIDAVRPTGRSSWFENTIASRQSWYGLARYWRRSTKSGSAER
jgi:glyoxylase-like metal-dependent hydrolase (beta-lactamase superfamily II)